MAQKNNHNYNRDIGDFKMKILIYDDNQTDVEKLKNNINIFFQNNDIDIDICVCPNIEYLYQNIKYFDILFLDIEIDHQNGIDIGMKLKKINHNCRIVITTNFKKYSIDGYKINADRYFIKPIDQNEFNIEMETIVKEYLSQFIGFYDKKISPEKIFFKDIIYIEFFDRKTIIHFTSGIKTYTTYNLKHWLELLKDSSFAQTHKSFIVNLNYIIDLKNNEIVLINQETIPLSRHYKKDFLNLYLINLSSHL